jgi:hypothetical protein
MSATAAMWHLSRVARPLGLSSTGDGGMVWKRGEDLAVVGAGGIWFAEVRRDRAAGK